MTNRYLVWTATSKPENGREIVAASSFEARKVCAKAWAKDVTDICARRVWDNPCDALSHHVSGAIARGEAVAIVEQVEEVKHCPRCGNDLDGGPADKCWHCEALQPMTFEAFRATREFHHNLALPTSDSMLEGMQGLCYAGKLTIETACDAWPDKEAVRRGFFLLTIGNESKLSDNLEALERELFEYGKAEGWVK